MMGTYYWGKVEFTFIDANKHFEGLWSYCGANINTGKLWTGDRL